MKYVFTATILMLSTFMYAQPGTLDSTFGTGGKVIFSPDYGIDCFGVAKQSDEKIICVSSGITVSRFSKDGILDTTFGINGLTLIDDSIYSFVIGYAGAVQADDKIIVAGYGIKGQFEETNYDMIIARLTADGKIDSSFGVNGIAIADYGKGDIAYDIAIQPDGKIIIQGSSSGYFNTLRYLPNGTLDASFGGQGYAITQFSGLATGEAVVLQPDGKIIAAGHDLDKILLVRYMPDGSLDETFGDNGTVRSDLTNYSDNALDMVLQPDGKIIVGGYITSIIKGSALLVRYNNNGSLDSSFGNNGFTIHTVGYASDAKSIQLQSDGKIITAGGYNESLQSSGHFTVSRFTKNGTIDSSFGDNGNTVTAMESSDDAYGLILQNDNKIVLAGSASDGLTGQLALARYNNDLTKKQIIFAKIRRWWQHHNGIMWDNMPGIKNYAIQRSGDGAHWSTVYSTSINHSQLPINNYYNDAAPLSGDNYYRLQTTSVTGAVNYSNVIAINNTSIKISPNPAKN
ncbi:MAG: hypothetical protein JST21_06115, partial [Bacteroidetes bacterium]|nr:hypothetical protein [Bacteroidota bacterium]